MIPGEESCFLEKEVNKMYEVAKLNSKFSDHYLNVAGKDGSTYHGGNQGWWQDKVTTGDDVGHIR